MLICPILVEIMSSQTTVTVSLHYTCSEDQAPSWILSSFVVKMPHGKKDNEKDINVLNYSKYKYAEMLPVFTESDRLLESDLNMLECYDEYQLEAPLNSFSDWILNDHLYTIYKRKQLETAALMRKLASFFVCRYQKKLTNCVKDYLESKKLTLDNWLRCVKENRCGDILCIYMLSLVSGVHTCVHLKDKKIWNTLQVVPLLHHELISRCEVLT